MAKTKTTDALQKQQTSAMAIAGDAASTIGHEDFDDDTMEDMVFPRLALAQRTSPQVDKSSGDYIEGLEPGMMFNNVTLDNYGSGPVRFAIVRKLPKKAIEFGPDNNVVDRNVRLDDPRCLFGPNGEKPRATIFYEYLIARLAEGRDPDPMILSMKTTQISVAKMLNTLLRGRLAQGGPIYGAQWVLTSTLKGDANTRHTALSIKPDGKVDAASLPALEGLREMSAGREVAAEGEPDSGKAPVNPDDIAF